MRKEFTFKSYFKYAFRYWLVIGILAVAGIAIGLVLGIVMKSGNQYVYQGNICISGVSSFKDIGLNYEDLYKGVKQDAFDTMCSENVSNSAYALLKNDWQALPDNGKLSESRARNKFDEHISVRTFGPFFYVSFSVSDKKYSEEYKAFGQTAVNTYLNTAKLAAERREELLTEKNMLNVTQAVEQIPKEIESVGVIKGMFIGAVCGIAAALAALIIAFFADRRIIDYGDIAYVTGRRLFAVNRGMAAGDVCPSIDVAANGDSLLAVCGEESSCRNLASLYAEYAANAGYKTLKIDFSRGAYGDDTFEKFIKGAPLSDCVTVNNGVYELHGERSWTYILSAKSKTDELKREYGKIVICAPYYADGSLSVICGNADKTVFVINQSKYKIDGVVRMACEAAADNKIIGAVIDCAGKSFVGSDTYISADEQEAV